MNATKAHSASAISPTVGGSGSKVSVLPLELLIPRRLDSPSSYAEYSYAQDRKSVYSPSSRRDSSGHDCVKLSIPIDGK